MTRMLGINQFRWLTSIVQSGGEWSPDAGHVWDTVSGTIKLCRSLERRGLLKSSPVEKTGRNIDGLTWKVTAAGRKVVNG